MDPLDLMLRQLRAHGTVAGLSALSAPWTLRVAGEAAITLIAPAHEQIWIQHSDSAGPVPVEPRQVALVRGPEPFFCTDQPRPDGHDGRTGRVTPVHEIGPGQGQPWPLPELSESTPSALLGVGFYRPSGAPSTRLLAALPPVAVVTESPHLPPMRSYLETEFAKGMARPGIQTELDRLLDWLLVRLLRDWFDQPGTQPPGWYLALSDGIAGAALRFIHTQPDRSWTLASLAAAANTSRTTLVTRLRDLLGESPLAYLTQWRMELAADLLSDPGSTVAAVARQVGYADEFSFSTAFKRVRGVSPSALRTG
ncbi:cupin domain-containing protein [Phytoactinopolyspora mesophila]|uniref:Helix-turn-helix domain-containing protein n=1 Tax=Phytoactinopolyspora mesophila TaxID=2650750 RepID=A0A7K3MAS1_9ACTN|nr:helix-turn-helix domain-containing protein [Phytoactinopolyspora mesophila]